MISRAEANTLVDMVGVLPYAPKEPGERYALALMFEDLVDTMEHGEWLIRRLMRGFKKYPGPSEIRAAYTQRFKAVDGINGYSELFPDGNYPDATPLPATPRLTLPAGHIATADPELDGEFEKLLAAPKGLPDPQAVRLSPAERRREAEFNRVLADVETPPEKRDNPDDSLLLEVELELRARKRRQSEIVRLHPEDDERQPRLAEARKPITQEDVAREVAKLRGSKGAA